MSGERGFTIAETLVALAILAVMLVALYEAMGTGFRTFDRAAEVEEAVLAAQSQLDRVVALRRLPAVREGAVDGTPLAWRLTVLERRPVTAGWERATVRVSVADVAIDRLILLEAERAAP